MLNQFKNPHLYIMFLVDMAIFVISYTGACLLRFEFTLDYATRQELKMVLPFLINIKLKLPIMLKITKCTISLIFLILICSCGGGGGGSNNANTVSGKAIDGYLYLATVCLDLNDNLICDAGEPTTTTNRSGGYTLTGVTNAQLNAHSILVVATAGTTIDQYLPNNPVVEGFTLTAPPGSSIITPITTLIVAAMKERNLSESDAATLVNNAFFANVVSSANKLYFDYLDQASANPALANLAAAMNQVIFDENVGDTPDIYANYYTNMLSGATQYIAPNSTAIQNAASPSAAVTIASTALAAGYTVTVNVTGLPTGQSVVLYDNVTTLTSGQNTTSTNLLTITGSSTPGTPITANFSIPVPSNNVAYEVDVKTQPTGSPSVTCHVQGNSSGTLSGTLTLPVVCN